MAEKHYTESIFFSIIVAVYQRENELIELLESLKNQKYKNFEIIIVDDGSPEKLEGIVKSFDSQLNIKYYYKENTGPGLSRNFGMNKASGEYFIFLDSDTIVPTQYLEEIFKFLKEEKCDFFGGADQAREDFNDLQKAISFAMTSIISTGGIRGKNKSVVRFQPRSFNMGISRACFRATGGFSNLRVGEDPDMSMSLWEKGFDSRFIGKAWVYHKRRNDLKSFGRQVLSFGRARPILNQRHPQYSKISFWFPTIFALGFLLSVLFQLFGVSIGLLLYGVYFCTAFFLGLKEIKNIRVSLLACLAIFIQLNLYGIGFLESQIKLNILKIKAEKAFPKHFTI